MNNQFNFAGFNSYSELPRVANMEEARIYPMVGKKEDWLLNKDDSTIGYYRTMDSNGFIRVTRERFFEEPEPTLEQINDSKYVTLEDFKQFKEEVLNELKSISAKQQYRPNFKQNRSPKSNATTNRTGETNGSAVPNNANGSVQEWQPTGNVTNDD